MAVTKNGKAYLIRVSYQLGGVRKDIRRTAPDKSTAMLIDAELSKVIAEAKAAQDWQSVDKVFKKKRGKTFSDAAAEYLNERQHMKPSTLAAYRSILSCYLEPEFGKFALSQIKKAKVAAFQSRIQTEKKLSPRRTNTIMQLLRSILGTAADRDDIDKDPTIGIKRVQQGKSDIDPLTETELKLVLNHIDPHYKPLFTTLAYSGARPNEVLALRWGDIDWQRREFKISKGLVRGFEGLPKTHSSHRTVPLLTPVETALTELKRASMHHVDGYIFLDKKGLPIRKHLDRIWNRALKAAGVRQRPSYQLRHTFASTCLQKGFTPAYVAKLLGHSTPETTYRHYLKFIEDESKSEERRLRDLMGTSAVSVAESVAVPRKRNNSRAPKTLTAVEF